MEKEEDENRGKIRIERSIIERDREGHRRTRKVKKDYWTWKHLYAVVDLEACLKYLKSIKRIAAHPTFIVNVPRSVYKTLDEMKDMDEPGCEEARRAFRWIESSLKRNNGSVHCQRDHEKCKIIQMDILDTENDSDARY